MAITSMLLLSCNKKAAEHEHNTSDASHEHSDREEHVGLTDGEAAQEEFTVATDSSASNQGRDHQY